MSPDCNKLLPFKERRFLCKVGFHSYDVISGYYNNIFLHYYVGCEHCFKAHPAYK